MNQISVGTLGNGVEIEILESGAILKKEVVVKINGIPCELFEISSQKRDGGKTHGVSISPRMKKPQFIESPKAERQEETPKATLSDIA
jgi:hypothetical protein